MLSTGGGGALELRCNLLFSVAFHLPQRDGAELSVAEEVEEAFTLLADLDTAVELRVHLDRHEQEKRITDEGPDV